MFAAVNMSNIGKLSMVCIMQVQHVPLSWTRAATLCDQPVTAGKSERHVGACLGSRCRCFTLGRGDDGGGGGWAMDGGGGGGRWCLRWWAVAKVVGGWWGAVVFEMVGVSGGGGWWWWAVVRWADIY